jgi:hypothetical protein
MFNNPIATIAILIDILDNTERSFYECEQKERQMAATDI